MHAARVGTRGAVPAGWPWPALQGWQGGFSASGPGSSVSLVFEGHQRRGVAQESPSPSQNTLSSAAAAYQELARDDTPCLGRLCRPQRGSTSRVPTEFPPDHCSSCSRSAFMTSQSHFLHTRGPQRWTVFCGALCKGARHSLGSPGTDT